VTKFAFVSAERANHAVTTLCRVVGASVSGFYAWLRAIPSQWSRAEAEAELRGHIGRIFAAKRRAYGAPRIHAELRREGHRHARRRIEQLMRDMGLQDGSASQPWPTTRTQNHRQPPRPADCSQSAGPPLHGRATRCRVAGRTEGPRSDISYIPTGEGFLYLAALKDMATRQIVGWSMADHLMADHLRAELCIDALVMALQRCRPPRGLIHHSDRGGQYASAAYQAVLERHGIRPSMSRRGNGLDNAPMESFFASLKTERVHQAQFRTRAEAKAAAFEYIKVFYNRQRLHSALGYQTPAEARASMEEITRRAAA
jgi:putative transposase